MFLKSTRHAGTGLIADGSGTDRRGQPFTNESWPERGAIVRGAKRNVLIDAVVRAEGPRIPNVESSPKQIRQAWVLLSRSNHPASTELVGKLDGIRAAWEGCFSDTNPVCEFDFVDIGTVRGDTGGTPGGEAQVEVIFSGEQWLRVFVAENNQSAYDKVPLSAEITLEDGLGQDYDLRVYCDGCDDTSESAGKDVAWVKWDEKSTGFPFYNPTGSDSGRYIYIEVVQLVDDSCEPWILTVRGARGQGDDTCSPK